MKADNNTIMPFSVKVMSKYKVLSKHERSMIKSLLCLPNKPHIDLPKHDHNMEHMGHNMEHMWSLPYAIL